ncbi:MAG: PGPGW domain-containing protein [Candidatus Binatia bacterium]
MEPKRHHPSWTVLRCAAGISLLAVGAALLVLPGPGIPLVLAGLTLLAPHSRWARRLLDYVVARFTDVRDKLTGARVQTNEPPSSEQLRARRVRDRQDGGVS